MDIVTHSLAGVALSRAFFQRVTPRATLLLLIAATIPDIDILSRVRGQLAALEWQYGYTHSLLALPVLALACVGLTAAIVRQRLPLMTAWIAAGAGVASHLILDWTGSHGIRALLPFSSQWFYLDLNGKYDGVILVALSLALIWPWFVGLVSGEIGHGHGKSTGQGSAILVLLFVLLYEGARWSLHTRALDDLNSRLYDGEVPAAVAALPDPNNPLSWTGVVETLEAYRTVSTGSLNLGNASDSRIFLKPDRSATYQAAVATEPFRYMSYFARFPVWEIEPVELSSGMGKLLDMTDLRFGTPGEGRYHALAVVDSSGRVLLSEFSFAAIALSELTEGAQR